jgi:peptidoglycan-associated lipoprotein
MAESWVQISPFVLTKPRFQGVILMRNVSIAVLMAGIALLAGCKTAPVTAPVSSSTPTSAPAPASTGAAPASTTAPGQQLTAEQAAKQALAQVGYVVYFDYDSAELKSESAAVVAAHAKYLSTSSSLKLRLEGSTDERGSREYNVGLGERRAQSVRKALLLQGVAESQITTLSYGEERPAVDGHDEAAWAKNRRVEFAY